MGDEVQGEDVASFSEKALQFTEARMVLSHQAAKVEIMSGTG